MRTLLSNRKMLLMFVAVIGVLAVSSVVYSHCQIPCGIYGDEMRLNLMAENILTIEKSMNMINQITGKGTADNMNQLVRWINNKEDHSEQLSHTVTYYFMAQRIKPAEKADAENYQDYVAKLTLLHKMMVTAMKAKQSVDTSVTKQLNEQLAEFRKLYAVKDEHKH